MKKTLTMCLAAAVFVGCGMGAVKDNNVDTAENMEGKAVVYQMFTRLFGNQNTTNKPWGTIEENGVGKFDDIDATALKAIKNLGATHVWYTGIMHHAVINDYTALGIGNDDPDVVKGRAGSPYAIKDYYNVNPDLATNPAKRLQEFEALIERSHNEGLRVIVDIVPNHIARTYKSTNKSTNKPAGVKDFGATDDTSVEYARDNNFYYVVGESFKVPVLVDGYKPLGGEAHPLSDSKFNESPAKWTGNGSRLAQPKADDWYETVKINYGVSPDGRKDFPKLPESYRTKNVEEHYQFWQGKDVPNSWIKFRQIAEFWIDKGIDGFRFDMAEMVPVEFWSYLNAHIKHERPDFFLLAEIYNPAEYRNYIQLGKMDYLYDKVEMYDGLKDIIRGNKTTDLIETVQAGVADIEHHMLHFLENHDEQRIATKDFAGKPENAKPAMVISTLISTSPTMLYFGQDVGEKGTLDSGFGKPTRTTIFDYAGVPAHQRWMNGGKFDGGMLSESEKALQEFYRELLTLSAAHPAFLGEYQSLHSYNKTQSANYPQSMFSFARWNAQKESAVVVVSNFSSSEPVTANVHIPAQLVKEWALAMGNVAMTDLLASPELATTLSVNTDGAFTKVTIAPLASRVLEVKISH